MLGNCAEGQEGYGASGVVEDDDASYVVVGEAFGDFGIGDRRCEGGLASLCQHVGARRGGRRGGREGCMRSGRVEGRPRLCGRGLDGILSCEAGGKQTV